MDNKLTLVKNSRQIPKTQDCCKIYCDILYAYLQVESYKNEDKRYINKKIINFVELGNKFDLSRQTVSKKFKQLIDLGLVKQVEDNKDIYELTVLNKELATLIPYDTLRIMTNALSEKSISCYVYLLNRYLANSCKKFNFTMDQIKTFIGLSTKTRSNNQNVLDILNVLQKLELIDYSKENIVDNGTIKTIYSINVVKNNLKLEC